MILTPNRPDWLLAANIAMCVMLLFTALGHFKYTKGLAMMVPSFIPFKTALVYLTGVAEIGFGFALLVPYLRVNAAYGLIIFLIIILPANIYASAKRVNLEQANYTGPGLNYLWFRIPEQVLFIIWVYLANIGHL